MATNSEQGAFRASLQASVAIAGTHPAIAKAEKLAVRLWGFVSGIVMLGGIAYAFFGGWYWALIGIVVGLLIADANRRSAARVVVNTASTDPTFREEMLRKGVLIRS